MPPVKTVDRDNEPEIVLNRRTAPHDRLWWHCEPGKDRASAIRSAVEQIEGQISGYRSDLELYMRAYGAGNVAGEGLGVATRWQSRQPLRLRLNLIEQVCDAMQAKVAKLRPRPAFLVNQGDWGLRKRAAAMEQAVDGEFYRNAVDELSPQVALDAFICGTGFWRVGRRGVGHPVIDRVFPGEIVVDPLEGMYQKPRTLYQCRLVDREYLIETFAFDDKTLADQIRRAPASSARAFPWLRARPGHTDTVLVIEAWHLPSGTSLETGGRDGVHTIVVGDVELLQPPATKFTDLAFPIVPLRWQTRQFGFFGRGIAEEIMPQQIEINYTLEKIQHILHRVSSVRTWINGGGSIAVDASKKLTNMPGEILTYTGPNPPVTEVVNAVPAEMFAHVKTLKADAFEAVGLSQFFATSDKPAGLNSGEAQRVYEDVGTERLIIKGRAYEWAHVELAKRVIDVKRAIANDNNEKESPVVVQRKRARGVTIQSLKFKDVDLDRDLYMLEVAPQSGLPGTPSGRKAAVSEWIQIGLCSPDEGRELLGMPDLKSADDEKFATRDSVLSAVEQMADDGIYTPPHPLLDIQQAKKLIASAFSRLEWEGCPETNLELIARYASQLLALEAATMPPPEMQQAVPQQPLPQQLTAA
jgi:hypothetical protein